MTFSERLASELQYQNKSQSDLARFLGTRQSTVGTWISKNNYPAADTALKVAQFLNVSLEYLITGKTTERKSEPAVSQEDKELLQKYHSLPDHDKNMVNSLINTAYMSSLQMSPKTVSNA